MEVTYQPQYRMKGSSGAGPYWYSAGVELSEAAALAMVRASPSNFVENK